MSKKIDWTTNFRKTNVKTIKIKNKTSIKNFKILLQINRDQTNSFLNFQCKLKKWIILDKRSISQNLFNTFKIKGVWIWHVIPHYIRCVENMFKTKINRKLLINSKIISCFLDLLSLELILRLLINHLDRHMVEWVPKFNVINRYMAKIKLNNKFKSTHK